MTEFTCEKCDYTTTSKKDYNKHLETNKHLKLSNMTENTAEKFFCDCGKEYRHRQSLYNHKKKCNSLNMNTDYKELYENALKEIKELKSFIKKNI
jgi:hypothetical protein